MLIPQPTAANQELVTTVKPEKRRRWRRERWSRQDRIEQERRLDDELRQKRQEQEARWCIEELARQETLTRLPPGVAAVEPQEQDGRVGHAACERCGHEEHEPRRCGVPCANCGFIAPCGPD